MTWLTLLSIKFCQYNIVIKADAAQFKKIRKHKGCYVFSLIKEVWNSIYQFILTIYDGAHWGKPKSSSGLREGYDDDNLYRNRYLLEYLWCLLQTKKRFSWG